MLITTLVEMQKYQARGLRSDSYKFSCVIDRNKLKLLTNPVEPANFPNLNLLISGNRSYRLRSAPFGA